VVDDSRTLRKFLSRSLNELGYLNILEAADGQAALALLGNASSICNRDRGCEAAKIVPHTRP
jgi:CheY-like chemotaxis protein